MTTPAHECEQCGACCKGTLIVETDYQDVLREPRILAAQVGPYKVTVRELAKEGKVALLACGLERPCPFLGDDHRCTIYATRPDACREFEPGSERCREIRAQLATDRRPAPNESRTSAPLGGLNPPNPPTPPRFTDAPA